MYDTGHLVQVSNSALTNSEILAPTIFHQPWWLDIASGGRYGVVESTQDGRVVGRLPYYLGKRFGFTVSLMPPLTHFLGPAIDEGPGSANTRFLRRLSITRELLAQLPRVAAFKQKFYRGITDVIAFQVERFDSAVQFTHEIAPQPADVIWRGMRDKTRNMVRKARRSLVYQQLDDHRQFIRLYRENLDARGEASLIELPVCSALIAASLARGCGRIYAAREQSGAIAAAIFCAWDATSAYYLMSTRAPDSGNGANTLVLWEAIKDVTSRGLIFDFDGLGTPGGVLFFSGFGAAIRPRFIVSSRSRWFRIAWELHCVIRGDETKFY